jgi:LacI family transcriptional regulator
MQDGHRGGMLAAEHLCARGCRRIAWFGPDVRDAHAAERLGGALAGLSDAGRPVPPELIVRAGAAEMAGRARELLARKDRPDGVIALWRGCALALRTAASELGLTPGRDFAMVGWCPEEIYESEYRQAFAGGPVPPAVVWSVRTMAETAISRLIERRENPELPALLVKVPVRLKEGA